MARVLRLLVTTGEPAGIGPDICLRLAAGAYPHQLVFAGDPELLAGRARTLGLSIGIRPFEQDETRAPQRPGEMRVLARTLVRPSVAGQPEPANAPYVLALLDAAIEGCVSRVFDAVVTAPVHKGLICDAGQPFSGHTEYFAERLGCPRPVMLLVAGDLRVALATTHLPLRAVPDALGGDMLLEILRVMHRDLQGRFQIERPTILVCGLNPHAGEGGHLGWEDDRIIAPAIARARAEDIDALGPLPADTVFTPRSLTRADAVLAMYHDQGLPVVKHSGFGGGVNVTLGLPIIRTSVDHGTALELAGSGQADHGSLVAAVDLAVRLAG
ncbi:MAG: 4-hydroxythreonine-4-phosphate dehydrogenase PdxA [Steroidobacteraceae bacterium]